MATFEGIGPLMDGAATGISVLGFIPSLFPSISGSYSALRLGVGLNAGGGGHVPFVNVFNADYKNLGGKNPNNRHCQSNGYGSTVCYDNYQKVGDGQFVDIQVYQTSNQQPLYVELEQVANDGICLAYITHTWPDGHKYGWVGDLGAYCGVDWYESNIIVDNDGRKTKCVWLDKDHSDGEGFLGLHLYMPAFSSEWSKKGSRYPVEWYCKKSAIMMVYDDVNDSRQRKWVENRTLMDREISDAQNGTTMDEKRQIRKRSSDMASELVVSQHSEHSAVRLCGSSTSFGPDFLALDEKAFCDMGTKALWPVCDSTTVDQCFDAQTKVLKNGSEGGDRAGKYEKITEWK